MRTFTIIGLLFSCLSLHAQIYVDTDATGTNDGTSWANAFTFLDTALSSASVNDQIWVAEGIYVPRDSFMSVLILFPITKDIKLYGGFDGTETMLSERDPVQHLTILSGDVNGDDIAGDFLNNRTDNREAISFIADSISSATIIDGFTFRGGHAAGIINNIGAAMTMAGSPLIRNCIFTNNYSRSAGGAVFIGFSDAVYAVIEDCAFSENLCDGFGGAINVQDVRLDGDPLQIINCSFTDNEADNSGGAVRAISSDLRIKGCTFDGNASGSFGGGLSVYQVSPDLKVEVDDNSFIGNQSNVGGGFFYEPENTGNSITVKHCDFKDNTANANGGGLRFFFDPAGRDVDASIHHCTFERNYAEKFGSGANITFAAANVGVDVDSCMFSENSSAPTEIGGSLIIYSGAPSSSLQLSHTTFTQNFGFQGGGLLIETGTGGELTTMVQNCDFTQNTGSFLAGGMSVVVQQGTELLDLNIMDCTFAENRMIRRGGPSQGSAIFLGHGDSDYDININRCTFTGNKNENGAAGIEIRELAHAQQESGAKIAIENSLFAQHDTGETVIVFTKATSPFASSVEVEMNNVTMAANEMHAIDATVAIPLTLRNSIFHSPNDLDIVTLFNPLVQSEGGNLFSDGSALSFGTADDTSQVDPLFTGVMPYPYQLQDISPAINLGVAYQGFSPSSIDILGNPRVQGNGLDAGAFENDIALFLRQRILDHTGLTIYPNPVQEAAHITLENDWQGEIQVRIFSASGKQVFQDQFTKHQAKASWTSTHLTLPAGAYQLVLSDGKRALSTSLIKQ